MKTCKLLIMAKLKFAWAHLPTQTRIHLGLLNRVKLVLLLKSWTKIPCPHFSAPQQNCKRIILSHGIKILLALIVCDDRTIVVYATIFDAIPIKCYPELEIIEISATDVAVGFELPMDDIRTAVDGDLGRDGNTILDYNIVSQTPL